MCVRDGSTYFAEKFRLLNEPERNYLITVIDELLAVQCVPAPLQGKNATDMEEQGLSKKNGGSL
jgi:hypothetical protein